MDGFFRIFKFVKTCKQQNLSGRKFRFYTMRQFHTVHIRHFDIGHQYIRLKFFHQLQSLYTVARPSNHGKPQFLPVDFTHYYLYYLFFIVH